MTISASSRAHSTEEVEDTGPHKLFSSGDDVHSPSLPLPSTIQTPDVSKEGMDTGKVVEEEKEEEGGQTVQTPLLDTGDVRLGPDPEVTPAPEEEEEDDGIPHDRGWAWVIVFGMFVNFVVLSGYLKSSGLFFVELLRKFNAPATHTALLFSIRAGIFSLCGLYVMNVFLPRFGSRKLVLMGGLLMSLSAILSSVANELTLLICIHSFLLALGMSMLISPGEVLIGAYFKQRRSLALSLAKCGASIGNMAVPPLISFLLQEYGLTGTLLLYGGVCLHSLAAAMLLRPTSFYSNRRLRQRQRQQQQQQRRLLPLKQASVEKAGSGVTGDGGGVTAVSCQSVPQVGHSVVSNGVGSRPKPAIRVESCDQSSSGGGNDDRTGSADEVPACVEKEGVAAVVVPRKAKSDVKPGAVTAVRGCDMAVVCSDSRLSPHAPGPKHPAPVQPESMSEMTCSRHFDTLEGDLAALAHSTPELGLLASPSRPFRQRTYSELPDRPPQVRSRAGSRSRPHPSLLEAISQSSVMKYMSVSSLDVVSADLIAAHVSGDVNRTGPKAAHRSLSVERASRTDGSASEGQKPACSCRRVLSFVAQCPKRMVFMLDFSLFKRPSFRLLMFYITVSPFVNITLDYLPALAKENGVTESQSSLLLSIIGGLDLVCRLSCGFIADLKILRVSTMIIISFVILALVTQFVRFMTSFEHLVVLAVLQGIFGGVANCLAPVLIIEFVGLHNMGKGIGFCQLVSGASMCAVYPFLGYIRDTTGSYAIVYHAIGCGTLAAALLLCLEGPIKKLEARKAEQENGDGVPKIEISVHNSSHSR